MRAVQRDRPAACFLGAARRLAELLYNVMDLIYTDRSAHMAVSIGVGRRAKRSDMPVAAYGFRTRMNDLRHQRAACFFYSVGKFLKLGNQFITVKGRCISHIRIPAVYRHRVNHDIACASLGAADKYVRQPLGHSSVCCFIIHAHRSHADTVRQCQGADLKR